MQVAQMFHRCFYQFRNSMKVVQSSEKNIEKECHF